MPAGATTSSPSQGVTGPVPSVPTVPATDPSAGSHIVTIQWGAGQSNFDSFTVTLG